MIDRKKEIEKKYLALLKRVKTDEYYTRRDLTNRVNCYVCACGNITKTKDVDAGCTPFLHECEKCGELARSTFYNDVAPQQLPTEEWYRPSIEEILKPNFYCVEHVLNGGLIPRKITNQ